MDSNTARRPEQIGFVSAASIGIGGMVGGAIFAVLGLSAQLAGGAMPVAFLVGGVVALCTSYSYAKLSTAFPDRGGTVSFINRAFGHGLAAGALNNLLLLSYVVVLSLYAYAFGGYGAALFPNIDHETMKHALISGAVIGLAVLNILAAEAALKTENLINAAKLVILFLFVGAAFAADPDFSRMAPANWAPPLEIIAGGMIIFVNYEGFELISNAAPDVRNRKRVLPAAHYVSVLIVIVLYLLIAAASLGVMSPEALAQGSDYALATAAEKVMGRAGFVLIAAAALMATASAINATFYCASRFTYTMAEEGEAPHFLERMLLGQPTIGLILIALCTLAIANGFNLNAISTMASSGFLLIFAAVNLAAAKLAREASALRWLSMAAFALCMGAFFAICVQVWNDPSTRSHLYVLAAMLGLAFAAEALNRAIGKKTDSAIKA